MLFWGADDERSRSILIETTHLIKYTLTFPRAFLTSHAARKAEDIPAINPSHKPYSTPSRVPARPPTVRAASSATAVHRIASLMRDGRYDAAATER